MRFTPVKVVAEVAAGHLGQMPIAKEMIKQAYLAGADYVKFQKRNSIECVPESIRDKPHPNQDFSYGKTYLQHREALEFSIDEHVELKEYCDQVGIGYATSVWDVTSAREVIERINPDYIKVPSPCNLNYKLIDYLFEQYEGGIHISTGMTTRTEILRMILGIYKGYERDQEQGDSLGRIVLYHCTSEYPCPFDRLYLLEIQQMKENFLKYLGIAPGSELNKYLKDHSPEIGFSNHGKGIACDIAAYIFGATWIERHFTYDRTAKYTDAAASLEPAGLGKLCRDLKNIHNALQLKGEMSSQELEQRRKLKWGH